MKNANLKQAGIKHRRGEQLKNRTERLLHQNSVDVEKMSARDIAGIIGELNSYQAELERQNAELCRIQAELEESRNKISDLYDFVPVGYFTFDQDYLIVDVNQTGAGLLSVERDALLARAFVDFVDPAFNDAFAAHCRATIEKPTIQTCQLKLIRADGSGFYAELDSLMVKGAVRESVRIRTSVSDVSERRRTIEEIARLAAIVESSNDAIIGKDIDGTIISWNRAAERIYGFESSEVFGKPFSILMPTDDRHDVLESLEKLKKGRRVEHFETVCRTKDGRQIHVSLTVSPIKDADGNLVGVSTISRDISERRLMEQALRQSEEQMRTILDASPDAILRVGTDLKVLWANKAALELNPEILEGTCCDAYQVWARVEEQCVCERAIESGEIETSSLCYPTPDGSGNEVCWESVGVPLRDSENQMHGAIMIARDITERKMAEKAMMEYQEKLRNQASQLSLAEERERRRIATNLHDNVIQGLALSMIKLDFLRESGGGRDNKLIDEISEMLGYTIEEMRDMTFDISSPTLYRFGLSAAVDELMDDLLYRRHSIEYEFRDDQQEKTLDDDVRVLLFQSIRELFVNVIKHAHAHKVWVSMERVGESACMTVRDDGVGFEVDKTHLRIHRAGGFGLFNIRERLDYIGGGMEIRSRLGEGSEFVLIAPLKNTVAQGKGIENGA